MVKHADIVPGAPRAGYASVVPVYLAPWSGSGAQRPDRALTHCIGSITCFPDWSAEYSGPHDVFEEGLEPLICGLFED